MAETKTATDTETVDVSSQNVAKLDMKVNYEEGAAHVPLDADFVKNLRNYIRDQLNEFINNEAVKSVELHFQSEDN